MTDNSNSGSKENKKGLLAEIAAGKKLKKAGSTSAEGSKKSTLSVGIAGALSSSDLLKGINRSSDAEHLNPSEVSEKEWENEDAAFLDVSRSASTSSDTNPSVSSDASSDESTTLSTSPKTPERALTPEEIAQQSKDAAEFEKALKRKLGAMRRHIETSDSESSDDEEAYWEMKGAVSSEPIKTTEPPITPASEQMEAAAAVASVSNKAPSSVVLKQKKAAPDAAAVASISNTAPSSVVEKIEPTPEALSAANRRPLPSTKDATSTPRVGVGSRSLPPAPLPREVKPDSNVVQKRPMPPAPLPRVPKAETTSAASSLGTVASTDKSEIKNKLEGLYGGAAQAKAAAASTSTPTQPNPVVAAAASLAPITIPAPPKSEPVTAAEKSAVFTPSASSGAASASSSSVSVSTAVLPKEKAQEIYEKAMTYRNGLHPANVEKINEHIHSLSGDHFEYEKILAEFINVVKAKIQEEPTKYKFAASLVKPNVFELDPSLLVKKGATGPKI